MPDIRPYRRRATTPTPPASIPTAPDIATDIRITHETWCDVHSIMFSIACDHGRTHGILMSVDDADGVLAQLRTVIRTARRAQRAAQRAAQEATIREFLRQEHAPDGYHFCE